jgi:hypothetical protein
MKNFSLGQDCRDQVQKLNLHFDKNEDFETNFD